MAPWKRPSESTKGLAKHCTFPCPSSDIPIGISDSGSRALNLPFNNHQDYPNVHTSVNSTSLQCLKEEKQFFSSSLYNGSELLVSDGLLSRMWLRGFGGLTLSKMDCKMQMKLSSKGSASSMDSMGNQGLQKKMMWHWGQS